MKNDVKMYDARARARDFLDIIEIDGLTKEHLLKYEGILELKIINAYLAGLLDGAR